jgi:hypothetical protein
MRALKTELGLRDIISMETYARSLEEHWSKVSAHFMILDSSIHAKSNLYGILWRSTYDKCLHEVTGKSLPGIKLILERGISEAPMSSVKVMENKYLLDEAARSIYKGLSLVCDFFTDVDMLSSILADRISVTYFGKSQASTSPIR